MKIESKRVDHVMKFQKKIMLCKIYLIPYISSNHYCNQVSELLFLYILIQKTSIVSL
jgi:hypothetical protein